MIETKIQHAMNKNNDTSKYHFKNLVFEGGGVKGIAYVGALEVLDQEGILKDIKRVAGTSAGAMVAVLVGLGYSAAELRDILWNLNFQNFLDDSWGYIRDTKRFITDYGWYKGDFFRNLMADFIKQKTGNGEATFKDLQNETKYKDINLIGADLSTGCTQVFNARNTPDAKVADAARISMSIPLFFAAVKGVNKDNHIYVDGGLLDNYAIKVFDRKNLVYDQQNNAKRTEYYEILNEKLSTLSPRAARPGQSKNLYVYNKETLGFRLDGKEEIAKFIDPEFQPPAKEIKSFFSYTKALITTLLDAQDSVHLHNDDWQRTVFIDTFDIGPIDFDISDTKKQKLVDSGTVCAQAYLEWYNNDEEKANK